MRPEDPPQSVNCPVRTAAERYGETVAVSSPEGDLTYSGLDTRAAGMAKRMQDAELGEKRVGIHLEKSAAQVALIFAAIRCGSVVAPLSTRIPPSEIPKILLRAGCSALITDDSRARDAAEAQNLRTFDARDFSGSEKGSFSQHPPEIPLSRPATIIFTSGSTGTPKAALHTFENHYASALGSSENIPLKPGDVWLHSLPVFHVGGLSILFRCVLDGATVALPGAGETLDRAIRRSGATHISLVWTQLGGLLEAGVDLSGVKFVLLGGSGIPAGMLDRAFRLGLPVHTSYGLTEMASQVTTTRPGASRAELATSGSILPRRELRISPEGEILVRGETLFAGYVTENGLDPGLDTGGWFHTGDLGRLDENGLLRVTGRRDNLFISGGENIQPEEIEKELRRLAGVEDAVVVPVQDNEFGERPAAFVRMKSPCQDLAGQLRKRLPGFKVPVAFFDWPDDAPQGMKVNRAFFRNRAAELR